MLNNPINASDPSGHKCVGEPDECLQDDETKEAGFTGGDGNGSKDISKGCGGLDQKRCNGNIPTYGDGLIGPPVPSYTGVFHTSFQMFQVTDPYYYGQAAAESYNDFTGGGGDVAPGAGALPGLFNDILLGYRPTYLKNHNPYDQSVFLTYGTTYQNIPSVNATSVVTLNSMEIHNRSNSIDSVINYTVNIMTGSQLVNSRTSAAPGQTANVPLPSGLNIYGGTSGFNISIVAYTGCTGTCISDPNAADFQGSLKFNFNP